MVIDIPLKFEAILFLVMRTKNMLLKFTDLYQKYTLHCCFQGNYYHVLPLIIMGSLSVMGALPHYSHPKPEFKK